MNNQNDDLDDQLYILLASMKEYREAIADDRKRLEAFYNQIGSSILDKAEKSLQGVVSWNRRNFRHTTRISTCKFFDALDKVSERFVNVFQCLGFRALSTQRLLKTFQIGKPLPMQLI